MDNTKYIAYFIGENNQLVNPDLMDADHVLSITFTTTREKITIPEWFRGDIVFATNLLTSLTAVLLAIAIGLF